jgi:heterodisulfide reductase subunit A
MVSAISMAEQGFEVHIVEREDELGGNLRNLHYTLDNADIQSFLNTKVREVTDNPLITVHRHAAIGTIEGFVGNYRTTITTGTETVEVEHGAIIVATGAEEYRPEEYLYGEDSRVLTQTELENALASGTDLHGNTTVMIQCVGSRDETHQWCSRVCCSDAVKNAIRIKEMNPDAQVFILYRDMRTYGFREIHYERAREMGVIFLRFDQGNKPVVRKGENSLEITTRDNILGEELIILADNLVLSPAIVPRADNLELAKKLKVPLNEDGYFLEAHVKLRPVDFSTEGIFLAGMAHSPKSIDESITQAYAAASRAVTLLAKGEVSVEPTIARIVDDACIGCGLCVSICPYNAIRLVLKEGGRKADVIAASCKGCGTCAASCPQIAISMQHFTNQEITAQIEAFLEEETA